ncbi:uncharacterized protein YjeT (DUF2065 family) [Friedmanniella endophytica]|uniref:Uncharacterized protein YjeT (DUF2065 family) n=1 Tax=Microlunatus kandeliicorticis TaxID=1759536 RepID=A0A7W3P5M0_9ACTN|nr:hypothetical protein [Microlunatus kandeliicorticis]MBA8794007.1 uncharacterized protein YjeT (DUF2065 family) [Microlunatus kandeliicorticis]
MVALGVVLLVLVAAFTLVIVINGLDPMTLDSSGLLQLSLFGARIPANELGLFGSGAVAMLVLIIALALIRAGLRRGAARRRQQRTLLKAASGQAAADAERKPASKRSYPGRPGAPDEAGREPEHR